MELKTKFLFALLLGVSLWTLFYNLGEPNIYHLRNESRRAQIAQEMLQTGDWLIPQLEEETILTKPPLFYWSVALCSLKTGVTQLTARIPSAISGLGIILFTFLIGLVLFNRRVAFLSAFALLATNFFMHQARYAELEAMLAFFITAAIFFFLKGYKDPVRQGLWFFLFFAMAGLGMMTKGPFALTFTFIPIIGMLALSREIRLLKSRAFLLGSIAFLCIVLPWPLFIMKGNPDFIKLVLWETAVRAATGFVHREPFPFYFSEIIRVLFPWIFMLPFAVWLACSRRLRHAKKELVFLLFWFLGNLLFLSLLKSKRDYYLFPIAPAVALLVGATWDPLWEWLKEKTAGKERWCLRASFLGGAVLAGLSFLLGNPFAVNIPGMHSLNFIPMLFFIGTALLSAALVKAFLPRRDISTAVFAITAGLMLGVHGLYFTYTAQIRNIEDSGKIFYQTVARIVPEETPLAFAWKNENYTFTFYARRKLMTIKEEKDIAAYMAAPEKVYLVMRGNRYEKLGPLPWKIVYRSPAVEHSSWKEYILLCNK